MNHKTVLVSLTESEVITLVEDRIAKVCTNLRLASSDNIAELQFTIDEQISQLIQIQMALKDITREELSLVISN